MTDKPSIKAKAQKAISSMTGWVAHAGGIAGWLLVAAIVGMPLGQTMLDFWTPKVQSVLQVQVSQPVKVEIKKGKM